MNRTEYREYRRLHADIILALISDLPHLRRVFPCLPYNLRDYCRVQLGILWEILDEFQPEA